MLAENSPDIVAGIGKRAPLVILVLLLLCIVSGCATRVPAPIPEPGTPRPAPGIPKPYKVFGKWYHPMGDAGGYQEKGIASWYGSDFHGKKTSNGETYNMYAMTAAHKTLPLGTVVRVHNLENGRKTEVRVNDRGPFVRGRIIDLSYSAAKELGVVGPGTAPVEVVALGTPAPSKNGGPPVYIPGDYYSGNFTIQIGAFTIQENAQRLKTKLSSTYKNVHITPYDDGRQTFYRVRLGRCNTLDLAQEYEDQMIKKGFEGAFVVAE